MSAELPSQLKAVSWSVLFAAGGAILGSVVDRVAARALLDYKHPAAKAGAQLVGGMLILGEVMRAVMPADEVSPIGDGLLLVAFMWPQRHIRENATLVLADLLDDKLPYPPVASAPVPISPVAKSVAASV